MSKLCIKSVNFNFRCQLLYESLEKNFKFYLFDYHCQIMLSNVSFRVNFGSSSKKIVYALVLDRPRIRLLRDEETV